VVFTKFPWISSASMTKLEYVPTAPFLALIKIMQYEGLRILRKKLPKNARFSDKYKHRNQAAK